MLKLLIFFAMLLSEVATDIYVPGLPKIANALNTDRFFIQLTISINLIGMAVSSILYGILSDCYGRRKVFLGGIAIFSCASILCCFINNIYYLIFMRFIQGFGAGAAGVIGHATLKDVYSGVQYGQILSKLGMIISLSPAVAPIIGGFIIAHFDWQVIFIILAFMGCLLLIMTLLFFQETLPDDKREKFQLFKILTSYNKVLSNETFLAMCGIQACLFMWLWNEIANLPFLFINVMGGKIENYGYYVSILILTYIIGTILNRQYLPKFGTNNMILTGIILTIIPDFILLSIRLFINLTPIIIVLLWTPSSIGIAFIVGNSINIALSSVSKQVTARASACLAFTQMAFGSLGIYIISILFKINNVLPISLMNITCSIGALIIYKYIYRQKIETTIK